MKIDLETGTRALIIHHKPLTEVELKRLLLMFDEVNLLIPLENKFFLKRGAVAYTYETMHNGFKVYSNDGKNLLNHFRSVPRPKQPENSVVFTEIINEGNTKKHFLFDNILPMHNGIKYKKAEDKLIDKFDSALTKKFINLIDSNDGDFNIKNSINLKIAFEADVCDSSIFNILSPVFEPIPYRNPDMIIPSPPFPEMSFGNFKEKIWPVNKYKKHYDDINLDNCAVELQFFSIVAKILKRLALCGTKNLIPVFIDKNLHDYFRYKIIQAKETKDQDFINTWNTVTKRSLMNLNYLMLNSSFAYLSDEILEKIPRPKILKYKEERFDKLYTLRKELCENFNQIYNTEIGDADIIEIEDFINRKIIPKLHEYDKFSKNIFLRYTEKYSLPFLVGTVSTGLGLVSGLSPELIALLGGVSPLFAEGSLKLSSKIYENRTLSYKNTFSYFIDLKNIKV